MRARTEASLASLLLTQRLLDAPAAPLKASEYWNLLDATPDPSRLFGLAAAQIAQLSGVPLDLAERIAGRLDLVTAFTFELDQAEQTGLRFVTSVDEEYPQQLVERLERSKFEPRLALRSSHGSPLGA